MEWKNWLAALAPMAEGASDGASGNGSGAAGNTAGSTPPAGQGSADAKQPAGSDAPHVNHKEFVDYGKRVQRLEDSNKAVLDEIKKLTGGTTSKKKDEAPDPVAELSAQVAQMRAEKGIRDAADEMSLKLTAKQRGVLERLYALERPADVGAWMKEQADVFGWKAADATQAAATNAAAASSGTSDKGAAAQQKQTNLGAGTRAAQGQLPDTMAEMDGATWAALSKEERRKFTDAQAVRNGAGRKMFNRPLPK